MEPVEMLTCRVCGRGPQPRDLRAWHMPVVCPDCRDLPRPGVLRFAQAMEAKLSANEHKGGWMDCSPAWLLRRLGEEAGELRQALLTGGDVAGEAADVANFAMMIAEVAASPAWQAKLRQADTAKDAHAELCGPVIELYDDDGQQDGWCCATCDWLITFEGKG